jgi:inner membrane protein
MNKMLFLKALAIGGLTFIILIALLLVAGVINDRQSYRDEAVHSIETSYAGTQTLIGPVLVRPYTETIATPVVDEKGVKSTQQRKYPMIATSFPRELKVHGLMAPSERRHGLYKVKVYEFHGQMQGHFDIVDPATEGTVVWGEPYLAFSVSDVRGIQGTPKVTVNGAELSMLQKAPTSASWKSNLQAPLSGAHELNGKLDFEVALNLAGTESLSVAPVADMNFVEIQSPWKSPLFDGQFLPRQRDISDSGFHATWEVSSLASGTQRQLTAEPEQQIDVVRVNLTTLIDPYSLSNRAVKYGILFVVLTFGGFLIFELMKRLPIHPVQYLLVGFGLAIFFLLLVSFSEHMPFGLAYTLSSVACIALLTFYLCSVLRSTQRGLSFGALLSSLYGAMYGLLISEDNALILGSLLLFFLLALVILITRKVDWYRSAAPVIPTPNPTNGSSQLAG